MSRETLIKATHATSLEMDDNQERAVDRIIAIAYSKDPLGSLILRAMAHDKDAYFQASSVVAAKIRKICKGLSASRVASAVLADFIDNKCPTCSGRKAIEINKVVYSCVTCNGSGLKNTRKFKRMVGGKTIPDEVYKLAQLYYSGAYNRVVRNSEIYLTDE